MNMTNSNNKRLQMVYNNNQVIMDAGYTMQSNYILPVLSRMVDEKIINISAQTVVQTILTYKHTEDNPFPSRDEIALRLGKSISYVKKALSSIYNAGILIAEKKEKDARGNTYNFAPFFALVEKFIIEFKEKKNIAVKIKDLIDTHIVNKPVESFEWS